MKKIYLVIGLFSCTSLLFSQQQTEFGLVVKAGNFRLPVKKTWSPNDSDLRKQTTSLNPGSSYSLGFWHSIRLGDHFKMISELLCRLSNSKNKSYYRRSYKDDVYYSYRTESIREQSIVLPIKFQYSAKKDSKWAFSLGIGLSNTFAASDYGESTEQNNTLPAISWNRLAKRNEWKNDETRINYSAGIYYQLNPDTAIGLEYLFENVTQTNPGYPDVFLDPSGDFFQEYLGLGVPYNINSFSISLSHNLLQASQVN